MEEESDSLLVESNDTEDTTDFAEELTSLGHAITPAEVEAWEEEDGPGYEQLDEDSMLKLTRTRMTSVMKKTFQKTVLCLTVKHWMASAIFPLSCHLGILLHLNVCQGSSKARYHPFTVEHSVWSSINFCAFHLYSCYTQVLLHAQTYFHPIKSLKGITHCC